MPAKVLVVIGSQTQGLLFKHLLEQQGLEAECADGVPAARAALAGGRPAALLVDSSSLGADGVAELHGEVDGTPMLVLGSAPLPALAGVQRADGGDPAAAAAVLAKLLAAAPADASSPADILRRGRILVVDDSVTYREFLRLELEAEGCRVLIARNAEEAEAALNDGGFDCVLLDLVMPGTSGVQLCRRFDQYRRDHTALFPILMLTSQETDEQLIACLEAGADDFIGKSRPMEILKAKMMALLRGKFFVEDRLSGTTTTNR
ncbi:response regulator [Azospirillum sp. TSO22-1]|uniref:response regulator transcription factor n=1 Tax=Azospirillum sp. TSO22-1 TaxID=716789 RepID=UPI001FFFA213|nr:response regulator [Azospirillum sp. TSO22-1]